MSTGFTDQMCERLMADIEEMARLKKLSNLELVHECLRTEAADYLEVQEMMRRLFPGYENTNSDGSIVDPDYDL